jgi:glycolate oxidase iron-sulfur subunit
MFNFSETANDCLKCAKCVPNCTIHSINPDETTSPRGFLALLGEYQNGNLELDKEAKDIFESCFLCTNCVEACPKSLPTDQKIEQVRKDIAEKYGIAWYKKAFFFLLRNRKIMDYFFKLGYMFSSCGFKIQENISSMKPRIPLPILKKDRLIPSFKKKSFLNSHPEFIDNGGTETVAIFIGCLANYNYTNIGDSLLKILARLKINVFLAKQQLCCSAPAYFTGDFETVDYLSKKNIEYFETFMYKVSAILIPEATCSAMIREDYLHYFEANIESETESNKWQERAKKVTKRSFMATEWLYKFTDLNKILEKQSKNTSSKIDITYHDPCHAKKMQGIYKEPRELLKNSFNIVEMENPNQCCGFGGITMQTEKHHLAEKVGDKKAQMIQQTNTEYVSAECSACNMQITNSLHQNSVDTVFKNPIELIAEALEK